MLRLVKRTIASGLRRGLSRWVPAPDSAAVPMMLSWNYFFHQIRSRNIRILSVFDIGVANGTPELYSAFPDAELFLFDPTPQSARAMEQIAARRKARVFNVALGETSGTMPLHVPAQHAGATLFDEVEPVACTTQSAQIARFDDLVTQVTKPALCKIDVQGAELMVLRGMPNAIHHIDFFILEVSTIPTLIDAPDFGEVNDFMQGCGLSFTTSCPCYGAPWMARLRKWTWRM
jgi:FkbM family methyltransferase